MAPIFTSTTSQASQHKNQQPTISIPTGTVSCTQDSPTVNIATTVMGTSFNSDINKLRSTIHQLSIWIVKNYHEYVQPPTSVHTDAPTGSQTSRNKRPYHQTGDRDWHNCWLFLRHQIIHNLRIVAWNANSVSTKKAALDLFLRANKIDLAAYQRNQTLIQSQIFHTRIYNSPSRQKPIRWRSDDNQ